MAALQATFPAGFSAAEPPGMRELCPQDTMGGAGCQRCSWGSTAKLPSAEIGAGASQRAPSGLSGHKTDLEMLAVGLGAAHHRAINGAWQKLDVEKNRMKEKKKKVSSVGNRYFIFLRLLHASLKMSHITSRQRW